MCLLSFFHFENEIRCFHLKMRLSVLEPNYSINPLIESSRVIAYAPMNFLEPQRERERLWISSWYVLALDPIDWVRSASQLLEVCIFSLWIKRWSIDGRHELVIQILFLFSFFLYIYDISIKIYKNYLEFSMLNDHRLWLEDCAESIISLV